MSESLIPFRPADGAYNSKLSAWVPTVTGSATVPVGTYSATSGADSQPGVTLSATGTSGGIEAVATVNVAAENVLAVSCILTASSATPSCTPIQVTFKDAAGSTIVTATPYADAAAVASATYYSACLPVPDGAVTAKVIFGYLHWASTGGYSTILQSPQVVAL